MATIKFAAQLCTINGWTILVLPKAASAKLPSRGMVMVEGTVNDNQFQAPLEPDGRGSHWLKIDSAMHRSANLATGETVTVSIVPSRVWPEPNVPADVQKALRTHPQVQRLWADVTPAARWDWLRWIGATNRAETRQRRIEVAFSKLQSGMRRPCCFNRTACCEPAVSKNGVLLEPSTAAV